MLTSQPHPDEFAHGYRGRLRVLNHFKSTTSLMSTLRKEMHPSETPLGKYSTATTLALAAGMPLQQLVQHHTLLPFHRAVASNYYNVDHGDQSTLNLINNFGTKSRRKPETRFCLDCIKEDIDIRGYAYWRRSHQLPGVYWCCKHKQQLANSPVGSKAFDDVPYVGMASRYDFSNQDFQAIFSNHAIQRYADIMNHFLCSVRPMSLMHAKYRIAEQFKKHQIRRNKKRQKPTLTDRVCEQVSQHWLLAQFPAIKNRLARENFTPIDCIGKGYAPQLVYALALAVLFDSSDEAIQYWSSDIIGLPSERKSKQHYRDNLNSKAVIKPCVEYTRSHVGIGKTKTRARTEFKGAEQPALNLADMNNTCRTISYQITTMRCMSVKRTTETIRLEA
jgi:hypothetical protein